MKQILRAIVVVLIVLSVIYGCYWLIKTISYTVFYEDMVQETIREMVKSGSLK